MRSLTLISVCLLLAIPCQAEIITVDDNGPADFNNIQAAIDDANDGDTVLVADGTYTGLGNRDIDFRGKAITVCSKNGPTNCIIDCNGSADEPHQGFIFQSNEEPNSILDGFIIKGGYTELDGGGLYIYYSSPTISNCTISGNTSEAGGGGISCSVRSVPAIINCVISNNQANAGGGIEIFGVYSEPKLSGSVITGNKADEGGACYVNQWARPEITNCTISGNSANNYCGGIVSRQLAQVTIHNSILWDNTNPEFGTYCGSKSAGHVNVNFSVLQSDWKDIQCISGHNNIVADPCFANPGYWDPNGTPADTSDDFWVEGDYHLLADSPCIDAGDPSYVPEPNETDLDGEPRVIGGIIDMGADEFYNGCFPPSHPDFAEWLAVGMPDCWCYPRQCHGDADGIASGSCKCGFYYVGVSDLNILISAWLVIEPGIGPGIFSIPNGICADFAHDQSGNPKTGYYRVGPTDLNILIANWLRYEQPLGLGVPPDCLD